MNSLNYTENNIASPCIHHPNLTDVKIFADINICKLELKVSRNKK